MALPRGFAVVLAVVLLTAAWQVTPAAAACVDVALCSVCTCTGAAPQTVTCTGVAALPCANRWPVVGTVTVFNTALTSIEAGIFTNLRTTGTLDIKNNADLLTIEADAFVGVQAQYLYLKTNQNLATIHSDAFRNTQVSKDLQIEQNPLLASIGSNAFRGGQSSTIYIGGSPILQLEPEALARYSTTVITLAGMTGTLPAGLFNQTSVIGFDIRLNGITVQRIGSRCFSGLLQSSGGIQLVAANALHTIEDEAFADMGAVGGRVDVWNLPELTTLGQNLFARSTITGALYIGESPKVTSIPDNCFGNVKSTVFLLRGYSGLTHVGSRILDGAGTTSTAVTIDNNFKAEFSPQSLAGLTADTIVIWHVAGVIPSYLFNGTDVRHIKLENFNAQSIASHAFAGLKPRLAKVEVYTSSTLHTFEDEAFANVKTTDFAIAGLSNLTNLGARLFHGSVNSNTFIIASSAFEVIKANTFDGLQTLSLNIQYNSFLRTIETNAFTNLKVTSTALAGFYLTNNPLLETIEPFAFSGGTFGGLRVSVNRKLAKIAANAFGGITLTTALYIDSNAIDEIEGYAFNGTKRLGGSPVSVTVLSDVGLVTIRDNALVGLTVPVVDFRFYKNAMLEPSGLVTSTVTSVQFQVSQLECCGWEWFVYNRPSYLNSYSFLTCAEPPLASTKDLLKPIANGGLYEPDPSKRTALCGGCGEQYVKGKVFNATLGSTQQVCVDDCGDYYFPTGSQFGQKGCVPCTYDYRVRPTVTYDQHCTRCTPDATAPGGGHSRCDECEAGYYLKEGHGCVPDCNLLVDGSPDTAFEYGVAADGKTCQVCDDQTNCVACPDAPLCSTCTNSLVLFNGTCIADCPAELKVGKTAKDPEPWLFQWVSQGGTLNSGNVRTGAECVETVARDVTRPVPTISVTPSALVTRRPVFLLDITFDDESPTVNGLHLSELQYSPAANVNFLFSDFRTVFRQNSLLVEFVQEGSVTFSIPANVAQDESLLWNTASSPLTITYDITKPVVTFVTPAVVTTAPGVVTERVTLQFSDTITTSLNLSAVTTASFVVESLRPGTSLTDVSCNQVAQECEAVIQHAAAGITEPQPYLMTFKKDVVHDEAGNGNAAVSSRLAVLWSGLPATLRASVGNDFASPLPTATSNAFVKEYFAENLPCGILLNSTTGRLHGKTVDAGEYDVTVRAFTTDGQSAVVNDQPLRLVVDDCDNQATCNGGQCIDDAQFDGAFECDCGSTGKAGSRCDAAAASAATDSTLSTTIGAVGGAAVLLGLLSLLVFIQVLREKRKREHRKDYHIFISYRVRDDKDVAEALCRALETRTVPWDERARVQVKCFWDAKEIEAGAQWKDVFLHGLEHCCLFVPLVSEAALAPMKKIKPTDEKEDNVLLEYEKAVALHKQRRLMVFPILIGNRNESSTDGEVPWFRFEEYGGHCFPNTPSATNRRGSIRETINEILAFQGDRLRRVGPNGVEMHTRPDGTSAPQNDLAAAVVEVLYQQAWCNGDKPIDDDVRALEVIGKEHWPVLDDGLPLNAVLLDESQSSRKSSRVAWGEYDAASPAVEEYGFDDAHPPSDDGKKNRSSGDIPLLP